MNVMSNLLQFEEESIERLVIVSGCVRWDAERGGGSTNMELDPILEVRKYFWKDDFMKTLALLRALVRLRRDCGVDKEKVRGHSD